MRRTDPARGVCVLTFVLATGYAWASDTRGVVTANGLPVPGATVTVTQGGKKYVTVTDPQGFYTIAALADGSATIDVQMTGFAALKQDVTISADGAVGKWELKQLSLDEMRAALKPVASAPFTEMQATVQPKQTGDVPKKKADQVATAAPAEDVSQAATEGLLVNGSVNNAATSQFSLVPRFGNTASGKSLYTYSLNVTEQNSALNAQSYSLTGFAVPKPQTNQLTGGFAVQGPLHIPGLVQKGPNIFLGYQRTENSVAISTPGLVPDVAERSGNFSNEVNAAGQPVVVYNPATGLPYANDTVPVSAQAQALLKLYPLPNFTGNASYNYQVPLVSDTHTDALNSNAYKSFSQKNSGYAWLGFNKTRSSNTNLLGFVDRTGSQGVSTGGNWSHSFGPRLRQDLGYSFSRYSYRLTPYWADRANISGEAGITGNDQQPAYWGPPTLGFTGGTTALSDGPNTFFRAETNGISYKGYWNHFAHNVTGGLDFRRQEFNYISQANARGTFGFTGAATASANVPNSGSDLADFLIGIADTASIGYGNADKYLRQSVYDAYVTDDWRVTPTLTVNVGARWEYGAPVTEIKNRLANLDVAGDFTAVATVVASSPKGALTGQNYPTALMRPDRDIVEPRLGLSWRPLPGSSLVVGAGYGITSDTSVYQGIALKLAQQAPFSRTLTLENSAACALTLANGFDGCGGVTSADTFGVDPNLRIGYLQTWNLKVQRDLPASMQMTAIYLGNKGTHGSQLFLPNTNPPGGVVPCPSCPTGFEYLGSHGDSTRESAQIQLRRRLKSGFTASVMYTYSKSIDDDSSLGGQGASTLGSASIAQDWQDLNAERGLSTFDQRHLLNLSAQYTTGMGKGGGTFLGGWRGRLYKEWTVQTQMTVGSGLPETPLVAAVSVAGYTSFVRPDVTGASVTASPAPGVFLNSAVYAAPPAGQWGDARRDSITGPNQFNLNFAMVRTFRLDSRFNLDGQISAANALNHVTYSSWITNIDSTQFGLPASAQTMRTVQAYLRLRF